jgi:NADH dehydrogenase FAD-containing subunit
MLRGQSGHDGFDTYAAAGDLRLPLGINRSLSTSSEEHRGGSHQLASIGHRRGVANILGMTFTGFVAWFLWRSVYLFPRPRPRPTVVIESWP